MQEVAADTDPAADAHVPATRQEMWRELDTLVRAASRGVHTLAPHQVERLSKLYRAAANHLAILRGLGGGARATDELNALVGRAHAVVYARVARRRNPLGLLWPLLAFPATVRATWRYHLVATLLLVAGLLYGYVGAAQDPDWSLGFAIQSGDDRTQFADPAALRQTLRVGREGEVGADENAVFAAQLWHNNTRVGLMCFFLGFVGGVLTALLVFYNGVVLGTYTWTFHRADLAYEWWAWLLPHGVTELLAIVLLAGGGLWLGHMVLAPGRWSRRDRLRQARGDVVRLLLFAFPMFFVAALLESFLRQSPLGDGARYAVAVGTGAAWFAYLAFVRPPAAAVARVTAARGVLERAVVLPDREEILGLLAQGGPLESPGATVGRGAGPSA